MNTFNVKIGSARILSSLLFCAVIAITLVRPIATVRAAGTADGGGVPSDYTLLEPLPDIGASNGGPIPVKYSVSFSDYVTYLYNLFIALAAVAAVFMIVWGGFEYVTTDSWQGKDEGKKKLYNAVGGLLLVLCSWLILHTIDPTLTNINPTLVPKLQLKGDIASSGGSTLSFLDQLQSDANTYSINANEIASTLADNRANLNDLNQKLSDAYDEYNALVDAKIPPDSPQMQAAEAKLDSLNTQLDAVQGTVVANTVQAVANAQLRTVSDQASVGGDPSATIKSITDSQAKLDSFANAQIARAQQNNNPGAVQGITNQKNYGDAMLAITKVNDIISNTQYDTFAGFLPIGSAITGKVATLDPATGQSILQKDIDFVSSMQDQISTVQATYNSLPNTPDFAQQKQQLQTKITAATEALKKYQQ